MTKGQRLRARKGVDSYNPEFLNSLRKAAAEGITIPCGERSLAVTLRHRLYALRAAMKREDHPDYPAVAKVVLTLFHDTAQGWCIVGQPGDDELAELLRNAGAGAPDIPDLEI